MHLYMCYICILLVQYRNLVPSSLMCILLLPQEPSFGLGNQQSITTSKGWPQWKWRQVIVAGTQKCSCWQNQKELNTWGQDEPVPEGASVSLSKPRRAQSVTLISQQQPQTADSTGCTLSSSTVFSGTTCWRGLCLRGPEQFLHFSIGFSPNSCRHLEISLEKEACLNPLPRIHVFNSQETRTPTRHRSHQPG